MYLFMFRNQGDRHACFSDFDNTVGRRFKSQTTDAVAGKL